MALSHADRRLLVRAFLALGAVELGMRVQGFRRLVESAQRPAAPTPDAMGPEPFRRAGAYARWLDVASRYHPVRARCLHRSLALHRWLLQDGLPSELRIGVRKEAGELKAHAWVELAGRVVNDQPSDIEMFTPLLRVAWERPAWPSANEARAERASRARLAYISQFELSSLPRRSGDASAGAGSGETVISTLGELEWQ
jgi:hypothetical protein